VGGEAIPLASQVCRVCEEVLGVRPVTTDDNFFELGGDSISALEFLTAVEQVVGRSVGQASLLEARTIGDWIAALGRGARPQGSRSALVTLQPRGARPRLFCMHSLNGTALSYEPLARHLGPEQPVSVLQAAALDTGDAPDADIDRMAARYAHDIAAQAPGPYFLGGHSFGGVVALEVAQKLAAAGHEVALVALFDTYNPRCDTRRAAGKRDHGTAGRVRNHFRRLLWAPPALARGDHEPAWWFAAREGAAAAVRAGLLLSWRTYRRLQRRPAQRVLRTLEDVKVANRFAYVRHVPRAYTGRVAFFRATDRRGEATLLGDPVAGWRHLAPHMEIHEVPGDHLSMIKEPHVRVLAERLKESLASHQPRTVAAFA
jgi:thioesterase domain-containing protein/acyl carrier protein